MERRLSGEVEAEGSSGPHGTVDPDLALLISCLIAQLREGNVAGDEFSAVLDGR